jgi:hypothetical protein
VDMNTEHSDINKKFHRTLWKMAPKTFLWLLAAALLCSCSTIVKINETEKTSEAPSTKFQKILVVGITPRHNLRQSFENIFAETLNDHGVGAVASHTLVSDIRKADESQLETVARQAGADAVIITRVLSQSEHKNYKLSTGHVEYRSVSETTTTANSSTTISMSGVGIVAGEMDGEGATLQTHLFDASSRKLIWTAMSSAAGSENDQIDVCWKLSELLTKALSKDAIIEINSTEFKIPSF